ncbi:SGNH/GDSL hydrolase family protein [Telluribacter humicola]|uniref:SGNH/GDSL hydrolase family protein n=1 Tax=Telluribacter humicola TaxID=1720261 RepID=UPI001A979A4B|nr:SGNH/GDSL hydrolase family protein [Telluribacter humicola]
MIQTIVVTLPGPQGVSGWTPVFALENADNRTLLHLTDWTGSNGNKPAVGYVGAAGLVTDPAQAINFAGRGITSVSQNEAADLIINYTDGTNATIPAYFAPMFAAAEQVANDTRAVDETAEWIETTRQQMQADKNTTTQAKEDTLNIFGSAEQLNQRMEETEGYRDQVLGAAETLTTAVDEWVGSKTQTLGRAGAITQFGRIKINRVLLAGTSIANAMISAMKGLVGALTKEYGDSGNRTHHLGMLGGSYTNTHLGWKKQKFGGFAFTRSRGESTSTPLSFGGYIKRAVLRYSKETDGGSFEVHVDGVLHGTVNCNGTQAYAQEYVMSWESLAYRTIELKAPASGFAYIETLDLCQDEMGIHFLDASLGGSYIGNFYSPGAASGQMAATIAPVGFTGLDSVFNNTSTHFKPDLAIVTWTVNDAGRGMTEFANNFVPLYDRLVEKTFENGVPLIIIIEMGGHYSLPNSSNHATFNAIREKLLSYRNRPHVTVLDWHAKSGLATTDAAVLEKLAYRYYPITALNVGAATFTGDFIHPNSEGYAVLGDMLTVVSGVSSQGRQGQTYLKLLGEATSTPALAPNAVAMHSSKLANMVGFQRVANNGFGMPRTYRVVGQSKNRYTERNEALWYSAEEINYAAVLHDYITSSGTSDEYGPYRQLNNYNQYMEPTSTSATYPRMMTFTIVVGPGSWGYAVKNPANTIFLPVDIKGVTLSSPGVVTGSNDTDRPQAFHFTVAAYGGSGNLFTYMSGKFYAAYCTCTNFACIPGRAINARRSLTSQLIMLSDLPAQKVIPNQTYVETINGKTVEKVSIQGGMIYKPLATGDKFFGMYRLQNRSAVDIRTMALNGTVTVGAYDEKYGGPLLATTANPIWHEAAGLTNAQAGFTYTIVGYIPTNSSSAPLQIFMFAGSNNAEWRLALDGTWTDKNTAYADLSAGFHHNGEPIAITFTLPDTTQFDNRTWALRVRFGGTAGANGRWVLCEGSSATV